MKSDVGIYTSPPDIRIGCTNRRGDRHCIRGNGPGINVNTGKSRNAIVYDQRPATNRISHRRGERIKRRMQSMIRACKVIHSAS